MKIFAYLTILISSIISQFSYAAGLVGNIESSETNWVAIGMFIVFVIATLGITKWASSRTKSASDFYTAGGGITGFQNGLAIAGDFMSAASFLGISGMVYLSGFDGLIYSIGFLVGWPIITFLMAERLRNLGRFTFSDVVAYRFEQKPIRVFAACSTLIVVSFYLIAQMVGAGQLIKLLSGDMLSYQMAVILVGILMMIYVLFGGMTATTWVQIIKAVLLLAGASFMAFMVLYYFNFSPERLLETAVDVHEKKDAIMGPSQMDPISSISLGMALMFGTAGLPHVMMRFFTVPNAKEARKSVFWATTWIGYFYILTFIIGFGAIALVSTNPEYVDQLTGVMRGGGNMPAMHLADAVGGNWFLGFISAVAFATILAVVAGLTLSGASAVSHDLYATVIKKGQADSAMELKISRLTTLTLGAIAVILGIVFEKQNIAFMVGLAFAIAASANFPALFMSVLWKNATTRGVAIGGSVGLFTALLLTILSKSVWVDVLMNESAIFPYSSPAIFSIPLAFFCIWLFSITDHSERSKQDRGGYAAQKVRSETGIGASGASSH